MLHTYIKFCHVVCYRTVYINSSSNIAVLIVIFEATFYVVCGILYQFKKIMFAG